MTTDREIPKRIRMRYPSPLDWLLVEMWKQNKDYWLEPPMDGTYGAEKVRKWGLTENQIMWAEQIAEQMDGDHPSYEASDSVHLSDDEIASDMFASELIDDVE